MILCFVHLLGPLPGTIQLLTELELLDLSFNGLIGAIPQNITKCQKLKSVNFYINELKGPIPEDIGNLTALKEFILAGNYLSSSIPEGFAALTNLTVLDLSSNELTGVIPEGFVNCTKLMELYLYSNALRGPIPANFHNLIDLMYFDLGANALTGTIPPRIIECRKLQYLILYANKLQGSLPNGIGNLTELIYFDVDSNRLTGTIPESIVNCHKLQLVYLNANKLHGTLPEAIFNITELTYFAVSYNKLTGTLPDTHINCRKLQFFYAFINQFHGTIPSGIGNMTSLVYLDASNNLLTGTIPRSISNCKHLQFVMFTLNGLWGAIPSSFADVISFDVTHNEFSGSLSFVFHEAQDIDLSYNFLTGSLPAEFFQPSLLYLTLTANFFQGSITTSFCRSKELLQLFLSNNSFSGPFPSYCTMIGTKSILLPQLQSILLSYNAFSGDLPIGLLQQNVSVVGLDQNAFAGSIPNDWFINAKSLTSLVLAVNCLTGTIPTSICESKRLQTISLDGLHIANQCSEKILPFLSSSYVATNQVGGTLPDCIFTLPKLVQLQVSANAFGGNLPAAFAPSMQTLIVANNRLRGSIPDALWNAPNISYLDVSFNKFRDKFPAAPFSQRLSKVNSSLELYTQNNRFSGSVSSNLVSLQNINLLEGNLLQCNPDRRDLPSHDPSKAMYDCGSDTTNQSLLVWIAVLAIALVLYVPFFLCYAKMKRGISMMYSWTQIFLHSFKTISYVHTETATSTPTQLTTIVYLPKAVVFFFLLIQVMKYLLLLLCVVLVPILIILNHYNSMYINSYVWTVSTVYLSGLNPAIVLLILFCVFLVFIWWKLYDWLAIPLDQLKFGQGFTLFDSPQHHLRIYILSLVIILCNIAIVMTINFAFVYTVANNYYSGTTAVIALSILLSLFKIGWNWLLSQSNNKRLQYFAVPFSGTTLLILSLFNNIIVPYLADIFYSPHCLLYIIKNSPQISAYVPSIKCGLLLLLTIFVVDGSTEVDYSSMCVQTQTLTEFYPPFQYSYQCSSSVLTIFVPVFVYRYILSGIIYPFYLFTTIVTARYWKKYVVEHSKEEMWTNSVLCLFLPQMWKELLILLVEYREQSRMLASKNIPIAVNNLPPDNPMSTEENIKQINNATIEQALDSLQKFVKDNRLVNQFVTELLTSVAIMISFGILFPPLAFIILFSLFMRILIFSAMMGLWIRLIQVNITMQDCSKCLQSCMEIFDYHWKVFPDTCKIGLWLMIFFASWVWSFTLFDTLGDEVGFGKAFWIVLVMCIFPLILLLLLVTLVVQAKIPNNVDANHATEIENNDEATKKNFDNNNIFEEKLQVIQNPILVVEQQVELQSKV
jgi:Leucine-rich repeat (LRR) protein